MAGRAGEAPARVSCSTRSAGRSTIAPAAARSSITTATTSCRWASSCTSTTRTPTCRAFDEFQRFKTHPAIRATFEGGKRIGYGARAITEGGWQSIPKLDVPGRRAARLRGRLHERAAHQGQPQRHAVGHRRGGGGLRGARRRPRPRSSSRPTRKRCYAGDIARDLKPVRNAKPLWSRFGTYLGIRARAASTCGSTPSFRGGFGFTLKHKKPDYATLKRAQNARPIAYPKPDGVLTFDRLTSVSFSGTNHEENQPVHLKLTDPGCRSPSTCRNLQSLLSATVRRGSTRSSPTRAGIRAFRSTRRTASTAKLAISRTRARTSHWVCPEGGGGPNYAGM